MMRMDSCFLAVGSWSMGDFLGNFGRAQSFGELELINGACTCILEGCYNGANFEAIRWFGPLAFHCSIVQSSIAGCTQMNGATTKIVSKEIEEGNRAHISSKLTQDWNGTDTSSELGQPISLEPFN